LQRAIRPNLLISCHFLLRVNPVETRAAGPLHMIEIKEYDPGCG
jgi:hypothetical protein